MFSGWGIRTMAQGEAGFNPIEYHNGTVWPHDSSIVAAGLARYGFREEDGNHCRNILKPVWPSSSDCPKLSLDMRARKHTFPCNIPSLSPTGMGRGSAYAGNSHFAWP